MEEKFVGLLSKYNDLLDRCSFFTFVLTGILLFNPYKIVATLGFNELVLKYKIIIGALFLFSLSIWLTEVAIKIIKFAKHKYNLYTTDRWRKKKLYQLTEEEKQLLSYYIKNQTNMQSLDITNGTVRLLEAYQIIGRASEISNGWFKFSYNIQPWAWKYLNKHPNLLQ